MENTNSHFPYRDEFFSFTRKDLFIKVILLFPIATLFQYHIGILNKMLFFFVLLILFAVTNVYRRPLVYLSFASALWVFSMFVTPLEALFSNFNMAFYYIFLVFYMVFFLTHEKEIWSLLIKNRRYIYYVTLIYTLIVTISIFLPSSYAQVTSGGWGDASYFMSISGSPNRVGPASVFIVILLAFLIKTGSPRILAVMAIPQLYVFLMGGSRTYFVVGICAVAILYYVILNYERLFFASLIPMGAVLIIVTLQSSMMDKFIATFEQGTSSAVFWQTLTNTRSVFWVEQLKLFFDTPLLYQFFGNGINFTTYRYGLWAHSDFIEILCSYGYVGLINYLGLMFYCIRTLMKTRKRHFLIKCICAFIWFFNAFFNFFYCYFCAMLCYPILLLLIQHIDDAKTDSACNFPACSTTPLK